MCSPRKHLTAEQSHPLRLCAAPGCEGLRAGDLFRLQRCLSTRLHGRHMRHDGGRCRPPVAWLDWGIAVSHRALHGLERPHAPRGQTTEGWRLFCGDAAMSSCSGRATFSQRRATCTSSLSASLRCRGHASGQCGSGGCGRACSCVRRGGWRDAQPARCGCSSGSAGAG